MPSHDLLVGVTFAHALQTLTPENDRSSSTSKTTSASSAAGSSMASTTPVRWKIG